MGTVRVFITDANATAVALAAATAASRETGETNRDQDKQQQLSISVPSGVDTSDLFEVYINSTGTNRVSMTRYQSICSRNAKPHLESKGLC